MAVDVLAAEPSNRVQHDTLIWVAISYTCVSFVFDDSKLYSSSAESAVKSLLRVELHCIYFFGEFLRFELQIFFLFKFKCQTFKNFNFKLNQFRHTTSILYSQILLISIARQMSYKRPHTLFIFYPRDQEQSPICTMCSIGSTHRFRGKLVPSHSIIAKPLLRVPTVPSML